MENIGVKLTVEVGRAELTIRDLLRLSEGSDLGRFARLNGAELDTGRIAGLVDLGLVTTDKHRLTATAEGRTVLNGVLRELLA